MKYLVILITALFFFACAKQVRPLDVAYEKELVNACVFLIQNADRIRPEAREMVIKDCCAISSPKMCSVVRELIGGQND